MPLALRRRAPLLVFALMALVAFTQWLTADLLLADVALLVALYSVAVHERRRWGVVAAVVVMEVGALLLAVEADGDGRLLSFLSVSAFVAAAAALGVYVRTRRDYIATLLVRAEQLERERDQQAQLAAAAERARIARELHDVVAHNLTVMIALADGARLTAGSDPAAADAAIGSVSATGREALGEMRRLLGVLREDAAATTARPMRGRPMRMRRRCIPSPASTSSTRSSRRCAAPGCGRAWCAAARRRRSRQARS